jgi:hypothetical protein
VSVFPGLPEKLKLYTLLALIGFSPWAGAQLCTGSLGDPVVNITFGTGGGNTSSYTPPGYTYAASSPMMDFTLLRVIHRVVLVIHGTQ